jgi:plasmid stability protein
MGDLLIRNLDDGLKQRLQDRAKENAEVSRKKRSTSSVAISPQTGRFPLATGCAQRLVMND